MVNIFVNSDFPIQNYKVYSFLVRKMFEDGIFFQCVFRILLWRDAF